MFVRYIINCLLGIILFVCQVYYYLFVRYTDIKQDLEDELDGLREEGANLENVGIFHILMLFNFLILFYFYMFILFWYFDILFFDIFISFWYFVFFSVYYILYILLQICLTVLDVMFRNCFQNIMLRNYHQEYCI